MAKTAKLKKRQTTIHSRAARRAFSPSLDLSPSIRSPSPKPSTTKSSTTTTTTTTSKPSVLAPQASSGISKSKKSKPLKRQQRLRHLTALSRAEDNIDKLENKVQKSVGREKKVRERRKGWEEVNEEKRVGKAGKARAEGGAFGVLGEEEEDGLRWRGGKWGEEVEMDGVGNEAEGGEVKQAEVVVPESVAVPVQAVPDGEML